MKEYFYDDFDETEEDEDYFDENDFCQEEIYPTAEEYNRIHKQKYDYF